MWRRKRRDTDRARRRGSHAGAVYLVRHGEVHNPDNVVYADLPGYGLSETGKEQAGAVATWLADRPITVVVTSPLERARQTAAVIAGPFGLDPVHDERLTEWRLGNRWAGTRWDDLATEYPGELEAYLADPTDLPFSPEPISEVAQRVIEAIGEHAAANPNGDVVIVSHQDPIQAARRAVTGRDFNPFHGNKPAHASVISLVSNIASDVHADSDWVEGTYWEPEQTVVFPPLAPDQD